MALAPENTIEAFRLAVEVGATGLESDVHLAADGTPMLVHDAIATTRDGPVVIGQASVAELQALGIPALADLYDACGAFLPLSLDLNDARAVVAGQAVIACARAAGQAAVAGLRLCHEHVDVLRDIGRDAPDVTLVHSTELDLLPEIDAHARWLATHGIGVLNLHRADWVSAGDPSAAIETVHAAGCEAFAWDTQDLQSARTMLAAGIDGIYGNDPRILIEAARLA